jgi:hypothetical protein
VRSGRSDAIANDRNNWTIVLVLEVNLVEDLMLKNAGEMTDFRAIISSYSTRSIFAFVKAPCTVRL